MIELQTISFAHTPYTTDGTVRNALPSRKNGDTAISNPEWILRGTNLPGDSQAVYITSDILQHIVTIKVNLLRSDDTQVQSVFIRAIDAAPFDRNLGCLAALVRLFTGQRVNPDDLNINILGTVLEREVTFDQSGQAVGIDFTISGGHVDYVASGTTSWLWQYRLASSDTWTTFGQSNHTIYAILEQPTTPWVLHPIDDDSWRSVLWTDVLTHTCWWARGQRTISGAAGAITEQLYARGGMNILRYETTAGISQFFNMDMGTPRFKLQGFLDVLTGEATQPGRVNCDDTANALTVFANALGCELWVVELGTHSSDFNINPVRVIGIAEWNHVTEGQANPIFWLYHTVAMTGQGSYEDNVFDGLIQLNGNHDPASAPPYNPILAKDFPFGEVGSTEFNSYRHRLARSDNHSQGNCSPQNKYHPIIWWAT